MTAPVLEGSGEPTPVVPRGGGLAEARIGLRCWHPGSGGGGARSVSGNTRLCDPRMAFCLGDRSAVSPSGERCGAGLLAFRGAEHFAMSVSLNSERTCFFPLGRTLI